MRHIWSVVCSKASIDRETNNISLFEVLESVQMQITGPFQYPGSVPLEATFVTLWARDNSAEPISAQSQIRILAPDRSVLGTIASAVDLQSNPRTRQITQLKGFPIVGSGPYEFEVAWRANDADGWHVVSRVPFEVSVTIEAPSAATTT